MEELKAPPVFCLYRPQTNSGVTKIKISRQAFSGHEFIPPKESYKYGNGQQSARVRFIVLRPVSDRDN
jgi:hypothetical protein